MAYKSLSLEYTFNCELYWTILQMAYQFMREETAREILGNSIAYFDPDADYTYKPVTSAIELEYSKKTKIQNYTNLLQIVSSLKHPQAVNIVNYILLEILKLMGGEYSVIQSLFNQQEGVNPLKPPTNAQSLTTGQTQAPEAPATTNQYGMEMTNVEAGAREAGQV
jgi:hypothetical protein